MIVAAQKRFAALSDGLFFTCSGERYGSFSSFLVGVCVSRFLSRSQPKASSLIVPSGKTLILVGVQELLPTPLLCAESRVAQSCFATWRTSPISSCRLS